MRVKTQQKPYMLNWIYMLLIRRNRLHLSKRRKSPSVYPK